MYIQNRRESAKSNDSSPHQLLYSLKGNHSEIAYFAYTRTLWGIVTLVKISNMKKIFFEYYPCTKDKEEEIWSNGIFSFDTNVLLNLYRYSDNTRNDFISVLNSIKARLIITHQVGFEYHKNRLSTIQSQTKAYDGIISFLKKKCNEIEGELNKYKKHSYIESSKILNKIQRAFNTTESDLKILKDTHPNLISNDIIRDSLVDIFEGCVYEESSDEDLKKIYQIGKMRYSKEIPPGYKDYDEKKNDPDNSLYGDLIIWKELISYSKKNQRNIVFVTDDLKEDWWYKFQGKTIGPRPELLKEFYNETKHQILIYSADKFLSLANHYISTSVDNKSVDEIKEIRNKDESILNSQALNKEEWFKVIKEINKNREIYNRYYKDLEKTNTMNNSIFDLYKKFNVDNNADYMKMSDFLKSLGKFDIENKINNQDKSEQHAP